MIYRLRAECFYDVLNFRNKTFNFIKFLKISFEKDINIPDIIVEFQLSENLIVFIKEILKSIPDSHTMIETLDYKTQFTGMRLYGGCHVN